MYIFLDESGDMGFDFHNKKPSRYFVMTLLVCYTVEALKKVKYSVRRTLMNKKNHFVGNELKGFSTKKGARHYMLRHMSEDKEWGLYSVVIDKKR